MQMSPQLNLPEWFPKYADIDREVHIKKGDSIRISDYDIIEYAARCVAQVVSKNGVLCSNRRYLKRSRAYYCVDMVYTNTTGVDRTMRKIIMCNTTRTTLSRIMQSLKPTHKILEAILDPANYSIPLDIIRREVRAISQ